MVDFSVVNKMMKEKERKTTIEIPISLLQEMALRVIEYGKPFTQKYIVAKSVKAFLTSNVRADDAAKKLMFNFQLTDDPEDRLEIPLDLEQMKILHAQVHLALRKAGANPNECQA